MNKLINRTSFLKIKSSRDFNHLALKVFNYQFENCKVYRSYCDLININCRDVKNYENIPFLPISLFKTKKVKSFKGKGEKVFFSSTTSNGIPSKHYVKSLDSYSKSFRTCFNKFYGKESNYVILALLPSYLERKNSSLIYMVETLIKKSNKKDSGFYLYNFDKLIKTIKKLESTNQKTILIGVSFALIDLIKYKKIKLKNTIVMETGGMKGKQKEISKKELHNKICSGFGIEKVHSEYGMTELLSQAYSNGKGIFHTPPWMKILIRSIDDPLESVRNEKAGGINIIDLANIHSCSFIATDDLGKKLKKGGFEILGRFDNSDLRGCNLLTS